MDKQPTDSAAKLAKFAIEDFGTIDVPVALRRRARLEAARLGITPREALDRIREREAAQEASQPKRGRVGTRRSVTSSVAGVGGPQVPKRKVLRSQSQQLVESIAPKAKAATVATSNLETNLETASLRGSATSSTRRRRSKKKRVKRDVFDLPRRLITGGAFESNRRRH